MTALQAFRLVASEFSATSDETVDVVFELVGPQVSESKFGKLYPQALAYLAAHWLAWQAIVTSAGSSSGMTTGGRVTSEREGDLSRSYADNSRSPNASGSFFDNLERTAYGLEFKRLVRMAIVPLATRMG